MQISKTTSAALLATLLIMPGMSLAEDVVSVKRIGMELARDIANAAVDACRERGYQVSAVVVDRTGHEQAILRDTHANRFTVQIAREKANSVVLSRTASGVFKKNRADIREEMNHVDGILMLRGALPIESAGSMIGAIGVSGAHGGDIDEACAREALDSVADRLAFAD